MSVFELTATDGPARAGVLHTPHGDVLPPAFLPVGPKATVQGANPAALRPRRPADALQARLGHAPLDIGPEPGAQADRR